MAGWDGLTSWGTERGTGVSASDVGHYVALKERPYPPPVLPNALNKRRPRAGMNWPPGEPIAIPDIPTESRELKRHSCSAFSFLLALVAA